LLDRHLPDDWEVYVAPHLNGLEPDLVLLSPTRGVGLCYAATSNVAEENAARRRMGHAREALTRLLCPELAEVFAEDGAKAETLVRAGLVTLPGDGPEASNAPGGHVEETTLAKLERGDIDAVVPGGARLHPLMTERIAAEVRAWLVDPETAGPPLELPLLKRRLATTRTRTGYRRIKGPAGSGKSLVLAARAAHLSSEGKVVLIVTFNITLGHYLRDLAQRYHVPNKAVADRLVFKHFHGWLKQVCVEAGCEKAHAEVLRRTRGAPERETGSVLGLVEQARKTGLFRTYDAILVDEGQDFSPEWWSALRLACRAGGEMMLVADQTQDLFGRARDWTEAVMAGAGFSGEWARLQFSYRLPRDLLPHVRRFADEFLVRQDVDVPVANFEQMEMWPVDLVWRQVDKALPLADLCADAVQEALAGDVGSPPDDASDVTFLVQDHEMGLACVRALASRGIRVSHVFARDTKIARARKKAFAVGGGGVRGVTIHSFKGWEARRLVVLMTRSHAEDHPAAIYVALTRLARHADGNKLTVLCSEPRFAAYGRTWPVFEALERPPAERPSGIASLLPAPVAAIGRVGFSQASFPEMACFSAHVDGVMQRGPEGCSSVVLAAVDGTPAPDVEAARPGDEGPALPPDGTLLVCRLVRTGRDAPWCLESWLPLSDGLKRALWADADASGPAASGAGGLVTTLVRVDEVVRDGDESAGQGVTYVRMLDLLDPAHRSVAIVTGWSTPEARYSRNIGCEVGRFYRVLLRNVSRSSERELRGLTSNGSVSVMALVDEVEVEGAALMAVLEKCPLFVVDGEVLEPCREWQGCSGVRVATARGEFGSSVEVHFRGGPKPENLDNGAVGRLVLVPAEGSTNRFFFVHFVKRALA
jgi:hypothetical protein